MSTTTTRTDQSVRLPGSQRPPGGLGEVPEDELTDRVAAAGAVWEELAERLVASGMLPSVELAEEAVAFLDGELLEAVAAHTELLRRWVPDEVIRTPRQTQRGRGIDGR